MMTTQELIELAVLDAMALLDDDERGAFDAAFRGATPGVQAQVRREQARLSRIESLLPDVEPPAGLRAAVLEAVRRAIAELTPSGRRRAILPPFMPSTRVSPLWRAGAMALAAACVVLGLTVLQLQTHYAETMQAAKTDALLVKMSETFGHSYVRDVAFNRDTRRVVFSPEQEGAGVASVFVNPEWARAMFLCDRYPTPDGRTFKLAIINDNDELVQVLAEFSSNGGLETRPIQLDPSAPARLAILATVSNGGQPTTTVLSRGLLPAG